MVMPQFFIDFYVQGNNGEIPEDDFASIDFYDSEDGNNPFYWKNFVARESVECPRIEQAFGVMSFKWHVLYAGEPFNYVHVPFCTEPAKRAEVMECWKDVEDEVRFFTGGSVFYEALNRAYTLRDDVKNVYCVLTGRTADGQLESRFQVLRGPLAFGGNDVCFCAFRFGDAI